MGALFFFFYLPWVNSILKSNPWITSCNILYGTPKGSKLLWNRWMNEEWYCKSTAHFCETYRVLLYKCTCYGEMLFYMFLFFKVRINFVISPPQRTAVTASNNMLSQESQTMADITSYCIRLSNYQINTHFEKKIYIKLYFTIISESVQQNAVYFTIMSCIRNICLFL